MPKMEIFIKSLKEFTIHEFRRKNFFKSAKKSYDESKSPKLIFFAGDYWLDPNGGAPEDAVLVHCNFETRSSCISPLSTKVW